MKYLGIIKHKNRHFITPDSFKKTNQTKRYETIEISGNVLLLPSPINKDRLAYMGN